MSRWPRRCWGPPIMCLGITLSRNSISNPVLATRRPDSRFRAGLHLFNYTSFSLAGMARSLLYKGLIDQSKVFARLAIEEAEKSGRPATLCRSLAAVLPVFLAAADFGKSAKYISQMSDLSATYSLLPYRAAATGLEGQCLALQGNLEEGIPLLRKGLEELRNQRNEMLTHGLYP